MSNKINITKDRPLIKNSQQQNQLKTNALISKIKNCFVLNNIHISTTIGSSKAKFYHQLMLRLNLDSSIQIKNYHHYHLTSRLNLEYNSTTENVALQGTPKNIHSAESLSLPVCPFLLSQKLIQVKNKFTKKKKCKMKELD
ncbi:hypothetical protein QE197_08225 [Arsenophonus nasoniae]|uniref:Uncharacterized protein n=1 Tax=Arsenophonus nasoniae TaxID=638 RepID=D2TZF9_9GAMM|nr:hypothetical protein [Arsenophonus nasoniae]QBY43386.1 hypothetical protein ArsFIN_19530 [Arsenophonus nasoniae]WGM07377.1 hypothetical protein QE258_09100 [Arsenophonus nasoniae]WGM12250.1 hypothetical protein QE197_08225 [Arsenophonus nasoniae]WGM16928.1 hypothetical protein QE193_08110 [Arsenophonus nasoniae]CBA73020.1 hypothetical protein ARN_15700 [Arsenophonus nasoniae]